MDYRVFLKYVRIRNFRSILDETIFLDQYNIFVGRNDCGKSNVLKALNLFFNGETDFGRKFNFTTDYCQKGKTGKGKAQEIIIELSFQLPSQVVDKGIKTWKKVWRSKGLHTDNLNDIFGSYSKGPTFLSRIVFEYVPAVKSTSYFKDLLLNMYNAMTNSANASLAKVNEQYSNTLKLLTQELSINIKNKIGLDSSIRMPDDLGILFRDMQISTDDKYVTNINLDNRGDGIKARHIPAMLLFISQKIKESREKNAVGYTIIWGYEEPENGVEFAACENLSEELYLYSNECQILLTTHSPAIYSSKDNDYAKCYYAYKDKNGLSKYESDYSVAEINNNIGLMPLIAPYIKKISEELKIKQDENNELLKTIETIRQDLEEETGKVFVYTEGETDAILIKKAINKLGINNLNIIINAVNCSANKKGNEELCRLLETLSANPVNNNIVIGIFDRDVNQRVKNAEGSECELKEMEYARIGKNIYAFILPIPHNRVQEDQISIEHFFTDAEIKTINENGQRLFIGNEFNKAGNHKTDNFNYRNIANLYDTIKIIQHETNKYVTDKNGEGDFSLSKMRFAQAVSDERQGFAKFDFSEFNKIFNVIKKIILDAKN